MLTLTPIREALCLSSKGDFELQNDPVIQTTGLVRRFNGITAVDGISFDVQRGEVFGFLGHNGAGKTTTIRLLNGVLTPSAGSARVLGHDPAAEGPALRRSTGVLTESPSLDDRLSARENLTIYAELYGVPEERVAGRVSELLEHFDLSARADDRVGGFSKGMRQRLALARALIHEPQLLFLDEPTAGLDPVASRDVHELITRLTRGEGRTVFLCTHNLVEAQRLCDRVAVLERGKLLAMGTPAELSHRYAHTQQIEVEVDPGEVAAAHEILRHVPGLVDITTGESTVSFSGARRHDIPNVIAGLAASGVHIYRVTPEEPSLEDVYFALHGDGEEVPA